MTTRTLRRDFNVRLTYLDIEQSNGVYQLASHYFRRRTERDMKILARLLHLDRLLPAMDAKLLSLMLDGNVPRHTGLCYRSRARNPPFSVISAD